MPKNQTKLTWVVARLGEDLNWWVDEVSDPIHWDVDGLSILDPRQWPYVMEMVEPLHEFGLDPETFESAFIAFQIDKDLGKGRLRLKRVNESFLESEEQLFILPDVVDDETGPYAEFLDKITKARVKLLNDAIDFEQPLQVEEVEELIREEQSNLYFEGKAIHVFSEVLAPLEFVPAGYENILDDDDDEKSGDENIPDDIPEFEDDEEIARDDTMKWDEDEEEEEDFDDEDEERRKASNDDDDDEDDKKI